MIRLARHCLTSLLAALYPRQCQQTWRTQRGVAWMQARECCTHRRWAIFYFSSQRYSLRSEYAFINNSHLLLCMAHCIFGAVLIAHVLVHACSVITFWCLHISLSIRGGGWCRLIARWQGSPRFAPSTACCWQRNWRAVSRLREEKFVLDALDEKKKKKGCWS